MEILNKKEYEMIEVYKKTENDDVPLYFFNKFKDELTTIIYYKINKKFSSVPFEKGDLFYFVWNGIKKTLKNYQNDGDFNLFLFTNCYLTTLKEVKKFLTNGELIMNMSYSLEQYDSRKKKCDKNYITTNFNRNVYLDNLIVDACNFIDTYKNETIKQVIYLKSLGYTKKEIGKKLKINTYFVNDLLKKLEKMVYGR